MLEKRTVVSKIEVLEDGMIQVQRSVFVEEDGVRISAPIYARVAYEPGAEIAHEHTRVKDLAAAVWTPAVRAAFQSRRAAEREKAP